MRKSPIDTGKKDKSWSQRGGTKAKALLISTAIIATAAGVGLIWHANQPDKPAIVETVSPSLPSANWQIMSQSDIQNHAKAPEITSDFTVGKEAEYLAAVSPALQEKAKTAGYTIIYQGDPNDTTGRTIVPSVDRETSQQGYGNHSFGETEMQMFGVFKAWVPKPSDPQQKNNVYMLLENPLTKKTYLVDISLKEYIPFQTYATSFAVDNLNYGYSDIKEMQGNGLGTIGLPDDLNDPNKLFKKVSDFPTFNSLLKINVNLDDITQPGDYIVVWKLGMSNPSKEGVPVASLVTVGRFGGTPAWEKEVGIKQ